jgi:hypothetical protein
MKVPFYHYLCLRLPGNRGYLCNDVETESVFFFLKKKRNFDKFFCFFFFVLVVVENWKASTSWVRRIYTVQGEIMIRIEQGPKNVGPL